MLVLRRATLRARLVSSVLVRLRVRAADGRISIRWSPAFLASAIRDRKVAAIRAAAPPATAVLVASANPGCAMHLGAAGLDVRHPAELLADALAPPVTDTGAATRG